MANISDERIKMKNEKCYDCVLPNSDDVDLIYDDDEFYYKESNKTPRCLSSCSSCHSKCCDSKLDAKRTWHANASKPLLGQKSATSIGDFSVKYMDTPPKKRWTVSYDNRNYIKSQLSEDIMDHLIEKKKRDNASVNRIWKRRDW
ncbi:uncharacterized protein CDAR_72791 [Caerostris darwini]|uniref:Uncharacterized protein n=1 Tax=Caerostris darwini TaxID=1538125 RepID=A0AAV4MQ32_9ARAC|nr:uncharacterized protein CDAR_72791 [Caerostris darwini]